jgi:RHS repeat-associated protein
MSGALSSLTFSKNGATIHEARYYADEKGQPEDVILKSLDNAALHYSYDGLGRLTGQSIGPLFTPITYYSGLSGSTTNLVETYKNEDGNGAALQNYTYTYDANGNITGTTDAVTGAVTTYTYDGLNRLIGETVGGNTYVYNYDAGGNLTSVMKNGVLQYNYTYGNANWKDQMTAHAGNAINYDALGNPVSFVGYNLTWSKGRQLTSFAGNGLNIAYAYDASGHRTQQTVVSPTINTTINYTYSGDLLMRQSDGANTMDFQYDASGKMVGFMYNGTPYYYLRNLLGDVVAITDAAGNVVGTSAYDAWGEVIAMSGAIAAINPIRYRGYYQDPVTGWHYLNTRYYSYGWRRFINADSMFIAGDDAINASNMYAYCNGNPVMYSDPSGKLIIAATLWALGNYYGGQCSWIRCAVDCATKKYVDCEWNPLQEDRWNGWLTCLFGGKSNDFSYFSNSYIGNFIFQDALPWILNNVAYPIANRYAASHSNADWRKRDFTPNWGLQNIIWNFTMEKGARLGAFLLEFFPSSQQGQTIYTTREGQYQWQRNMGFNWVYDWAFSAGGPTKKLIFDFKANGKDYVVWCWKADYWNLGAGAEIGIYWQNDPARAALGFYDVDPDNLKVKVNMKVVYDGKQTYTFTLQQTNWWITLFAPEAGQRIRDLSKLQVYQAVTFDCIGELMLDQFGDPLPPGNLLQIQDGGVKHNNSNLFNALQNSEWGDRVQINQGNGLSWPPYGTAPGATKWDYLSEYPNYPGQFKQYYNSSLFDFYIQY